MDVSYLVKAYLNKNDIDSDKKQVVYVGTSPKRAFKEAGELSAFSKSEVEIWENGHRIKRISL